MAEEPNRNEINAVQVRLIISKLEVMEAVFRHSNWHHKVLEWELGRIKELVNGIEGRYLEL